MEALLSVGSFAGFSWAVMGVLGGLLDHLGGILRQPCTVLRASGPRLQAISGLACAPEPGKGDGWEDFREGSESVWKRFFLGAGSAGARKLILSTKLIDVQRCCWPAINFRCAKWPVSKNLLKSIRMLQRDVVASVLREPRLPTDDDDSYFRRRLRNASATAGRVEFWDVAVAEKIVEWKGHIDRAHRSSWPWRLQQWRGYVFLRTLRIMHNSRSIFGGRAGARRAPGRVPDRWHDGYSRPRNRWWP